MFLVIGLGGSGWWWTLIPVPVLIAVLLCRQGKAAARLQTARRRGPR